MEGALGGPLLPRSARPAAVVTDGSKGLETALAEVWLHALVKVHVHKEWNLLAHSPESRHEKIKVEYQAMCAPIAEVAEGTCSRS